MMVTLRIKELLKERKQGIAWLARETGMSYQGVFSLAKGKTKGVTFATLDVLCEALKCEPGELVIRTNSTTAAKTKRRRR